MRRLCFVALALLAPYALLAGVISAQTPECRSSAYCGPQDRYATTHLACYTDAASSTVFTLFINPPVGTIFTKTPSNGQESSDTSMILYGPNPTSWTDGVQLAASLQAKGIFPISSSVTGATWTWVQETRVDTMVFTAQDGTSVTFSSTACANWINCASFATTTGRHCWPEHETCCGANTMFPQCVDKTNGDQCCVWYKAAATCNATSTCCGELGPGASSSAFCCGEGTTCCNARVGYDGIASCCPQGTTCCRASTVGLCCKADEVCDVTGNRCVPSVATETPTLSSTAPTPSTAAPTSAPTETPAATTGIPETSTPVPSTSGAPGSPTPAPTVVSTEAPTAAPVTPTTAAPTPVPSAPSASEPSSTPAQVPSVVPATSAAPSSAPPCSVSATITLLGDFAAALANAQLRSALEHALCVDLAAALHVAVANVSVDVIEVTNAGRACIVRYTVATSDAAAASAVSVAAASLAGPQTSLPETARVYASATGVTMNITTSDSSASFEVTSAAAGHALTAIIGAALVLLYLFVA